MALPGSHEEHISPSQQIMMLLEENGITGPTVPHPHASETSPFDFSFAMQPTPTSGVTVPSRSSSKARANSKANGGGATMAANVVAGSSAELSRRESVDCNPHYSSDAKRGPISKR